MAELGFIPRKSGSGKEDDLLIIMVPCLWSSRLNRQIIAFIIHMINNMDNIVVL